MQRSEVAKLVIETISAATSVPEVHIELDKTLTEIGVDSLDIIEVINSLENNFNVDISDSEFMDRKDLKVSGIVDMLFKKVTPPDPADLEEASPELGGA